MNEQPGFDLVMPFVGTVSAGGPFDDAAFVAGYECGRLDERLADRLETLVPVTVHAANLPQLDLIAMRHGFAMTAGATDPPMDEWATVTFVRATS